MARIKCIETGNGCGVAVVQDTYTDRAPRVVPYERWGRARLTADDGVAYRDATIMLPNRVAADLSHDEFSACVREIGNCFFGAGKFTVQTLPDGYDMRPMVLAALAQYTDEYLDVERKRYPTYKDLRWVRDALRAVID